MSTELTTAKNTLEGFATHLETYWTSGPLNQLIGGWSIPPVSLQEMADRVRRLSRNISELEGKNISDIQKIKINEIPEKISWFQNNTLNQITGGNAHLVVFSFDAMLAFLEQVFPARSATDWDEVSQSSLIPKALAARLRSLESAIARLEPRAKTLEDDWRVITDAHQAALDLPTDLQSLKEAREEISSTGHDIVSIYNKARDGVERVDSILKIVESRESESKKLIDNIEGALSAATTVGLAASFSERAVSLTNSTRYWVALLALALLIGAVIGYIRLESFQKIAGVNGINTQIIWINAIMSLLAIAAPVWFAWLATRQISQRFRLAEDYSFKASVARAYEGYRKEAARLDPQLEARLFGSALDRLDEAPLRFVSTEEHGSPYESLLASTGFQKALEKFPGFRDGLAELLERTRVSK